MGTLPYTSGLGSIFQFFFYCKTHFYHKMRRITDNVIFGIGRMGSCAGYLGAPTLSCRQVVSTFLVIASALLDRMSPNTSSHCHRNTHSQRKLSPCFTASVRISFYVQRFICCILKCICIAIIAYYLFTGHLSHLNSFFVVYQFHFYQLFFITFILLHLIFYYFYFLCLIVQMFYPVTSPVSGHCLLAIKINK